jgi:molybdenum cofactor guanylyltransferase
MSDPSPRPYAGVILAGGLSRRMGGGDKPLVSVGGGSMLARVIARLEPQVERMVLSANGDPGRFAGFGLPVVPDAIEGFAGPLAGIHAGMLWAAANMRQARFIVSVAADTPFFPTDLVARLSGACGRHEDTVALAASAVGTHPVFGLWPVGLADNIRDFLQSGAGGSLSVFADRRRRVTVPFENVLLPDGTALDPFFNVNTAEDAARADKVAPAIDAETIDPRRR